jgi:transcriptional regulator with XRE-family HTH domain
MQFRGDAPDEQTVEGGRNMPEPLWIIREKKGMSVNQLASRSGVPAISITEYESGHAIRSVDLAKLAKALYVEEWDIEIKSEPRPSVDQKPPPPKPAPRPERETTDTAKAPRPAPPARPSQIEHLLNLCSRQFGKDRVDLEQELGKPLEEMTRTEASKLLNQYQRVLTESRTSAHADSPLPKRKRAYLPEGVDEFELEYLTAKQESGTVLRFSLFDGQQVTGQVIGFSPYSITIRERDSGDEITLQKLAIAYYRVAVAQPDGEGS